MRPCPPFSPPPFLPPPAPPCFFPPPPMHTHPDPEAPLPLHTLHFHTTHPPASSSPPLSPLPQPTCSIVKSKSQLRSCAAEKNTGDDVTPAMWAGSVECRNCDCPRGQTLMVGALVLLTVDVVTAAAPPLLPPALSRRVSIPIAEVAKEDIVDPTMLA